MESSKLMIPRKLLAGFCLMFFLGACGMGDFNEGKVKNIIEGSPMKMDAEYVTLTPAQVDCGAKEDLWDVPIQTGARSAARLTSKGRDLKFSDDVSIGDMRLPYVQIRGDFMLAVAELTTMKDGPEKETKLVETKLGAIIQHSCFPNPLPMMGVRHGKFSQQDSPVLFFRYNNGWQVEKLVH